MDKLILFLSLFVKVFYYLSHLLFNNLERIMLMLQQHMLYSCITYHLMSLSLFFLQKKPVNPSFFTIFGGCFICPREKRNAAPTPMHIFLSRCGNKRTAKKSCLGARSDSHTMLALLSFICFAMPS